MPAEPKDSGLPATREASQTYDQVAVLPSSRDGERGREPGDAES